MSSRPITHTRSLPQDAGPCSRRPVRLIARDLKSADVLKWHSHSWGQFTWAIDGVIRVSVDRRAWIVPPLRGIWVSAGLVHEVAVLENARLRTLHILADIAPFRAQECLVLDVSPLLRELMLALACAESSLSREAQLSAMLLNELEHANRIPMGITLPADRRLRKLCESLIADPSLTLTLKEWAQSVGASERTLARVFQKDVGVGFVQWRQQIRIMHAAIMIAQGHPLSLVSAELGYASQSAFSAMFKKAFGQSPSDFFSAKSKS